MSETVRLEFYKSGSDSFIAGIKTCFCPDIGEKINIDGETWKIVSRSWALDYSRDLSRKAMRVNLNCEPSDDTL